MMTPATPQALPYRLACLCDLRDEKGRILLLRRAKAPNQGLCSPIGGKLDTASGESPARCAQREILEEAGVDVPIERLHLLGLISECGYENATHWLLFVYRVLGSVSVTPHDMREGRLDWFEPSELEKLPLPETDRKIIWPLIFKHDTPEATPLWRPGFFAAHIDCRGGKMEWSLQQSLPPQPGS